MTKQEKTVLHLLSKGMNYYEIAATLKRTQETVHTICYKIRKHTGIKNTKDVAECRDYIQAQSGFIKVNDRKLWLGKDAPTEAQSHILKLRAQGKDLPTIAKELDISKNTVANAISQGCKRAGIRTEPPHIFEYLVEKGILPGSRITLDDPFFN